MKPEYAAHTPREGTDDWHTLVDHNHGVLKRAKKYAATFSGQLLTELTALWHDLGKYHPDFQAYLEQCHAATLAGLPAPEKGFPHAIYGAILAKDLGAEFLAPIIAGHHAGLYAPAELNNRLDDPEKRIHFQKILEVAKRAGVQLELPLDVEENINLPKSELELEMLLRFTFSALVDADFLDTEEHFDKQKKTLRTSKTTVAELHAKLENHLQRLSQQAEEKPVNTVRAEVLQLCQAASSQARGAFRLTVPTGGGKTLSGLMFALQHAKIYGLERVIVAVPYTSIIDQTVRVYREIFGAENVLEHHSAARDESLKVTEDPSEAKIRAKLATQNWDAPLIVTTTVQLFESLFGRYTSQCRKLHHVAKSVIILDEVQTLPLKLLTPITEMLKTLASPRFGTTVVFCTATQPALDTNNKFFAGFAKGTIRDIIPAITTKQHFAILKRVQYNINFEPQTWEELALEWHKHQRLLIVLNTRKDALRVLAALAPSTITGKTLEQRTEMILKHSPVLHLSTLLCGAHRRLVLETTRARLKDNLPIQLVSTQVIEAGVDVDFPVLYRALGPLDRILQAAGRCNREGELPQGEVHIFVPQDGGVPQGEYATALAEAKRMLEKGVDFDNPTLFETYFRHLYASVNLDHYGIQKLRQKFDYPEVESLFRIIPDDTTPVIIEFNQAAKDIVEGIQKRGFALRDDYRTLQPYLVNVRTRDLGQQIGQTSEIAPGMRLWLGRYDALRGIVLGEWSVEDLTM
jgi:CRISPR-associated endonuclease/helicase Cas3